MESCPAPSRPTSPPFTSASCTSCTPVRALRWSSSTACWEPIGAGYGRCRPRRRSHRRRARPVRARRVGEAAATTRSAPMPPRCGTCLTCLGLDRTVVGHSLGGGIALQFAYLFPERVEGLVLVSSGGLGRELSPLLRAATLPGASGCCHCWRPAGRTAGRTAGPRGAAARRVGLRRPRPRRGVARVRVGDAESRRAFLATSRSVTTLVGRRDSPLAPAPARGAPTLPVWGARDRMIPVSHAGRGEQVPKPGGDFRAGRALSASRRAGPVRPGATRVHHAGAAGAARARPLDERASPRGASDPWPWTSRPA